MDAARGGVERVRENGKECKDGEESSLCCVWKVRTKPVGITARAGTKRKGRKSGQVQGGKGGFYSHGIWDGKLWEKNFVLLKMGMVKKVWAGCISVGKMRKAPEW